MISIADTLDLDRIRLKLTSTNRAEAIRETADLLRTASEVLDWEALCEGLIRSAPCLAEHGRDFSICLPHVRTDAVHTMVMSVGRAVPGIVVPDLPEPARYIFCIGVPKALDSDYLRIVGLLTRILKAPVAEAELRTAATAEDFLDVLTRLETEL
jgi:PTS system nitrogen regulatory IIA component